MTADPMLDTTTWLTAGGIMLLLLMSAFFSGSETALTAASRGKLRAQADKGNAGAEVALKLKEDGERLIGAILLGNNVVNILAASLATALFTRLFGANGVAVATMVMTLLVLIFSEVLPKTYAITSPETAATRLAPPIRVLVRVLSPIVNVVRAVVRSVADGGLHREHAHAHLYRRSGLAFPGQLGPGSEARALEGLIR